MLFAGDLQILFWNNWPKGTQITTLDLKLNLLDAIPAALVGLVAGDAGCHQSSPPDYAAFAATLLIIGLKKALEDSPAPLRCARLNTTSHDSLSLTWCLNAVKANHVPELHSNFSWILFLFWSGALFAELCPEYFRSNPAYQQAHWLEHKSKSTDWFIKKNKKTCLICFLLC